MSAPLASGADGEASGWPYVAFDLNPAVVEVGFKRNIQLHYKQAKKMMRPSHPLIKGKNSHS